MVLVAEKVFGGFDISVIVDVTASAISVMLLAVLWSRSRLNLILIMWMFNCGFLSHRSDNGLCIHYGFQSSL